MKIKNLKVVAASLCLGTTLLTGCGEAKVTVGNSVLTYNSENSQIEGTITFENLCNYGKVVVFKDNVQTFSRLVLKKEHKYSGKYSDSNYNYIEYIDLETISKLFSYKDYTISKEREYEAGETLNIISETDIVGYLINEDFIKREYTVEELITFFDEKIKPTLDSSEKELVK